MKPSKETFQATAYEISVWGHKYPIKCYTNPKGYIQNDKPVACRMCDDPATFRLEIYDHLYQPEGSLYYCKEHTPELHYED